MSFARPAWLKVGIAVVIWASWIVLASATEVRTLKNIEVITLENSEQVRLEFDGEFLGDPLINFESGSISLRLGSVHTDPALPLITVPESDSLIKAVRTVQVPNTEFVHLDILLRSSRVELGHPKITHSGNSLILSLHGNISAYPALSNTKFLTAEIEKRVNTDPSFPSTFSKVSVAESSAEQVNDIFPMPVQDWAETILTLVLSLLFVLLLIYLLAYLYNRFFSGRFSGMQGNIHIRQVSSYHVGPKQKVIVFDMNGRMFACGVTPTSINLIAELHDETDQEFLQTMQTEDDSHEINIDQMQANYLKTLDPECQQSKPTPIQSRENEEDLATSIEFSGQEKGVFLKSNAQNENSPFESSNIKYGGKTPVRAHLSKTPSKTEKLSHGNQMMQDFASKLSERIKFLKPIK